jgi:Tol biopolymer transport system component
MMDERERLGRVVRGFAPPDDAFERLVNRKGRKQRNQRLAAGAVGLIVALATGLVLVRSLTSDGVPADRPEPRPSPAASGALAYALDGDIYVADPDGSNAVKIADGRPAEDCAGHSEYWAEGSMWSPDGRYLAYRYSDCSSGPEWLEGVVISDAEGNVLATFPTGRGWDIRWSPDSTRVAVWDSLFETIGVYGTDGARQTQLTMPPWWRGYGDVDPWWMPDGTSLMVEPNVELPLDGGTPRRLPEGAQAYSPAGDSPDGSHFAYVDHRSRMVARSDGSGSVTLLTVERGTILGEIGFSPQGDRILFWRSEDGESSLWSIGVDGSDARLVVAGTMEGEWLLR